MQLPRSVLCFLTFSTILNFPALAEDYRQGCEKLLQKSVGGTAKYSSSPPIIETLDAWDFVRKTAVSLTSPEALMANTQITERFISDYVKAWEDYYPDRLANYGNFDVVRVFSDPAVLGEYQRQISPSNPSNPGKRFGSYGQRLAQIEDITLLNTLPVDDEEAHAYSVRIFVDEQMPSGPRSYETIVQLALRYTKLELNERDACLNPVGLRVFSYDNSGGR